MKITKILLTSVITIVICTMAAMYTPPDFGHSVTLVSEKGGMNRHPVYLGLNEDNYLILVTGTVLPPYRGGFRIVLEGEPQIQHEILSTYPPELTLGWNHFYDFGNDTVTNIYPKDKFSIAVRIDPEQKITELKDYNLRFYDLNSDKPVLTIPVTFRELDEFSFLKETRRPYPEVAHESHQAMGEKGGHQDCAK